MVDAKNCARCNFPNPLGALNCGSCAFDFADWERRGRPSFCQSCGVEGETRFVAFHQHIGAVYLMFHKRDEGRFCKTCVNEHFWSKTAITGALGWWGFISLFVTPIVLLHNIGRYVLCLGMAAPTGKVAGSRGPRVPNQPRQEVQLVGQNCAQCSERIPSVIDGLFCPSCDKPVHNRCVRPGEGPGCKTCGAANPAWRATI